MVTLPTSLTLVRSLKEEGQLVSKARAWLEQEERSPGIHGSDLLDPRQAYWSKTKPLPLSDRMISIFLIGKVLHAIVLGAVDGAVNLSQTDSGSSTSELLQLTYSPDRIHKGRVYEFKTARNFKEPKTVDELSNYIEQLLVYMAATQTTESTLWVLYLNLRDEKGRTDPAFRAYHVTISEADLALVTTELKETRNLLYDALQRNDPSKLPLCREWKCSERMCDWWHDCKPEGRYKVPGAEETKKQRPGKTRPVRSPKSKGGKGDPPSPIQDAS